MVAAVEYPQGQEPPLPNDRGSYVWDSNCEYDTEQSAERNATVTGTRKPLHYHRGGEPCNDRCTWVYPQQARTGASPVEVATAADPDAHFEAARAALATRPKAVEEARAAADAPPEPSRGVSGPEEAPPTTRMVYVAGPIDFAAGSVDIPEYHRMASLAVRNCGMVVYSPSSAFGVPRRAYPTPAIHTINTAALDTADCLLAMLPSVAHTIGTPIEIERAAHAGKPVAVVTDRDGSWSLAGLAALDNVRVYRVMDGYIPWSAALRQAAQWLADRPAAATPQVSQFATTGARVDHMEVAVRDGRLPQRSYPTDAGLDLYTSSDTAIPPHTFVDVPCGISAALPDGWWGMIVGRSSTLRNRKLMVYTGIIDSGWRGPLFAGVYNMSDVTVVASAGDRLAQIIPLPLHPSLQVVEVDTLRPGDRGTRGFGSTGS